MAVRLDRLQQGLFEALGDVATNVLWTQTQVPQSEVSGDLLTLNLTSGPSLGLRQGARGVVLLPADSVVVRVDAATVTTRNVVVLNDFPYYRDTVAGDTVTAIRDALLALINVGELAVTASTDGSDGIALTADTFFSDNAVLETVGTSTCLVTVQCYSKGREPRNGAWALADAALDKLQQTQILEELTRFGLGLWDKGGIVNLSGIAGGGWESRAAFDLLVAARSVNVRPVDQIETVTGSIEIDIGTGADTVTPSATAP